MAGGRPSTNIPLRPCELWIRLLPTCWSGLWYYYPSSGHMPLWEGWRAAEGIGVAYQKCAVVRWPLRIVRRPGDLGWSQSQRQEQGYLGINPAVIRLPGLSDYEGLAITCHLTLAWRLYTHIIHIYIYPWFLSRGYGTKGSKNERIEQPLAFFVSMGFFSFP